MRDEKVCQVLLALKPFEQIHDLRLDRNVESGDWFVGDDEVGIDRQGACDANALTLPARELVWIALIKRLLRPTVSIKSCTRRSASLPRANLNVSSGSPTICPTVM